MVRSRAWRWAEEQALPTRLGRRLGPGWVVPEEAEPLMTPAMSCSSAALTSIPKPGGQKKGWGESWGLEERGLSVLPPLAFPLQYVL